jgi:hypothetical protein
MTVADNTSRNQYTATASQTVFAYTFEIVDKDDIVVLKNGTTLSEGTNYTVSNVGNDSGGNVTLTVGATAGDILTLYRDMPYARTQNYTNSGDFLASEVNSDFDNLWLAGEQTNRSFSQSIRKPITDSESISMELPAAASRSGKLLSFTSDGAVSVATSATNGTVANLVTYSPPFTGAVDTTVEAKLSESVSVKDFGAVGDGVTDDTDAIQAAINSSSSVIRIPEGDYKITDKNGAYGILISATNKTIIGDGLEVANLIYTSSATNRPAISVTASDVHIKGIRIDGTANATKSAQTTANCNGITFTNASECSVRFCQIIGGHYGLHFDNDTGSYGSNDHNIAEGNILRNFQSTGFIAQQAQYLLVQGNDAKDCKSDGFKIAEGTRRSRILGNTSRNNDRDGFDVYDGFIESVLDGNVAEGNTFYGYEIKGTSDGTDFVVRNSVFSNNVAEGNGVSGTYSGFSIISVRNCSFDGNIAISNTASGFAFNTVQGCVVTGCLASRNTQHGFDLSTNVSRTQFTGCQAVDNSWVNGTTQNGTYHGYNLESSSTGQFVGCMALNGTISGKQGGQGYGWYWPTAISGSRVQNCYTLNNVTGGFGGGTGWATSIGFFNSTDNGTLKGIEFTDDALSKMTMTGAFNEMAIVDGVTAPATASGKAFIYVDTADGDLKVKFGDGTVKTIATDT